MSTVGFEHQPCCDRNASLRLSFPSTNITMIIFKVPCIIGNWEGAISCLQLYALNMKFLLAGWTVILRLSVNFIQKNCSIKLYHVQMLLHLHHRQMRGRYFMSTVRLEHQPCCDRNVIEAVIPSTNITSDIFKLPCVIGNWEGAISMSTIIFEHDSCCRLDRYWGCQSTSPGYCSINFTNYKYYSSMSNLLLANQREGIQ